MREHINVLRPLNCVMSVIAVWVGTVAAGGGYVPGIPAILGMISIFLITGGGMAVNQYFEPGRKIEKNTVLTYSAAVTLAGIAVAYFINTATFAVAIVAAALLFAYAARIKKTMIMSNFAASALFALTFVYGGSAYGVYAPLLPLALIAFLSNMGREIYGTIDDAVQDRKYSTNTVAMKMGVLHARLLGNIFLTCAVIFSFLPYLAGFSGKIYLFFIMIADAAFIAATVAPAKYSSVAIKIGMVIAAAAFIAGAAQT